MSHSAIVTHNGTVLTNTLGDIGHVLCKYSIKITSEPIHTQPEIFSIPVFEVFVDLLTGEQNFPSTLTPIHRFSSHFSIQNDICLLLRESLADYIDG